MTDPLHRRLRRCSCFLLPLAFAACGSGGDSSVVARLSRAEGAVDKQPAAGDRWSTAEVGASFAMGSAVRTGSNATGMVKLSRGGLLRMDADTVVRFAKGREPAHGEELRVEAGTVEIEAEGSALRFATELGVARIEAGSRVRVGRRGRGLQIAVSVGRVVLDEDGSERVVAAGGTLRIDVGGVVIEDEPAAPEPAEKPPEPPLVAAGGEIKARVKGSGARVLGDGGWKKLAQGEHAMTEGARLKTRRGTTVELERDGQKAVIRGAAEVVLGGADGALVDAKKGVIEVLSMGASVRIVVPGGSLLVRDRTGGSQARVSVKRKATELRVGRGRVSIGDETLRPGERATLSRGGKLTVSMRSPRAVAFSFDGGESPVVHAPKVPIAVGIRFARHCPSAGTGDSKTEGIVEISGRKGFKQPRQASSGERQANLRLSAGSHRYRIRCLGAAGESKVVASGTLRIRRDAGRRRLARKPPQNLLDADGRRYKVLYQNQLPQLSFRWRGAPGAPSYQLHVEGSGVKKAFDASAKGHSLASGEIAEGVYTFWFSASGSKARSPNTHLVVDFDNAAATAYLTSVRRGEHGAIRVEGAVLSGWRVSANGTPVALDRHKRFVSELSMRSGETALAVKLVHSQRGVHYYVVEDPGR